MDPRLRPFRSVLYIPGSKPRALDKARSLDVDAIIFDLEDAVSESEKFTARRQLCDALGQGGYAKRFKIVRVNALDTLWGNDDAAAVQGADALLLPKVNSPADLEALARLRPDMPLWAMIETPQGVLNAAQIASYPQLQGVVMGTNDLANDLGARDHPDRLPLITGLGLCLLAAKAQGKLIIDGVYNAFKDEEGLAQECRQGRDMGFDGKSLIHPAQIDIANRVFAPSAADIDRAQRQIAAFEEANAAGQGVAVVDGRIVENLHIITAREIIAKRDAIAARTL